MAGVVNFSSDKLLCSHHQQQPLLTVAAAKNPIYCSDFDRKCTDNNQPEIQFIALAGAGAGGGRELRCTTAAVTQLITTQPPHSSDFMPVTMR